MTEMIPKFILLPNTEYENTASNNLALFFTYRYPAILYIPS